MKNRLVTLGLVSLLSSSLFADTFMIKDGWQQLGAANDITDLTVFNYKCVDYLWYYDNNDTNNPKWRLHVANGVNYNYGGDILESIDKLQGFWAKANSSCEITINISDIPAPPDISVEYIADIPLNWWSDTNATMPATIGYTTSQIIGDYIYTFGGYMGGFTNRILKAPISDPTIWIDTGSVLPESFAYLSSQIIGDYVYTFGGSFYTDKILRAPISDPTNWGYAEKVLPTKISYSTIQIIGDYIYMIGGYVDSAYSDNIFKAPISDPTTWSDINATMPNAVARATSQIIGDYIYTFGGLTTDASSKIYRAHVSDLTSWIVAGDIPIATEYPVMKIIGEYVYIFHDKIYRAPVSDPTSWTETGANMPGSVVAAEIQIVGDYIYTFGGKVDGFYSDKIFKAKITKD